jgi:VWFA-related protein
MHLWHGVALAGVLAISGWSVTPPVGATAEASATRTVYVTVTDNNGQPVPDLTAADFVVKEGGKEREVLKAERATTRMRLALMVEERLLGDGGVRQGIFDFAKRLQPHADTALITIGLRNNTVVDYTNDLNAIVAGLNSLSLNPPPQTNVAEGILDITKIIEKEKPERQAIVVVAISGGQSGGASANEVLNQLRVSGALMHSVTIASGAGAADPLGALADQSNREQVLGDGPKQSGGRRIEVTATVGIAKGLQQIAGELTAQYRIDYALPDGVKPDRRFNINLKGRRATLRAPSLIPDR